MLERIVRHSSNTAWLVKLQLFAVLALYSGNSITSDYDQATVLSDEIINIFSSAQAFIFKNQSVINSNSTDKAGLFGSRFLSDLRLIYKELYDTDFPNTDHPIKSYLLTSMVAVMNDNRALIMDDKVHYKGFIPAVFAFQLSQRFSNGGYPVSIKFVGFSDRSVNELNKPDPWEVKALDAMRSPDWSKSNSFYEITRYSEANYLRTILPIYHNQQCLSCHGVLADNPRNKGKPRELWTVENRAGFSMQNFKLNELAGGISLSIALESIYSQSNQ
jgi:mono/diheme cytochrome c family protein